LYFLRKNNTIIKFISVSTAQYFCVFSSILSNNLNHRIVTIAKFTYW